jgi:hypothetical protein
MCSYCYVMYSYCYVFFLCYVLLLLCILIVIYFYSYVMYSYEYVMYSYCYVFLLLYMFCSGYSVSLCFSMYCLCVNVNCIVLLPAGDNPIVVHKYIIQNRMIFYYATKIKDQNQTIQFCTHWIDSRKSDDNTLLNFLGNDFQQYSETRMRHWNACRKVVVYLIIFCTFNYQIFISPWK